MEHQGQGHLLLPGMQCGAMATTNGSYRDRILTDPEVLAGKPTVRGTRIPVDLVLKRLSQDLDLPALFASYPRLTEDDVKACLAYAWEIVEAESERAVHGGHADLPSARS